MAHSQSLALGYPACSALKAGPEWKYNRWLGRWRAVESPERPCEAVTPFSGDAPEVAMPFDDSDKTLVERVKAGDVRAFEMLHRRYY